ncbi:MAG: hypothetical protein AAFY05_15415 [Pseudomonadota bacterium]
MQNIAEIALTMALPQVVDLRRMRVIGADSHCNLWLIVREDLHQMIVLHNISPSRANLRVWATSGHSFKDLRKM